MIRSALAVAVILALAVSSASAQEPIPMPDSLQLELDRLMGEWDIEMTIGDQKFQGTYKVAWAPEQTCAIFDMHLKELPIIGDLTMTGVIGWDATENRLKTVQFNSLGDTSTILWSLDRDEWDGQQSGLLLGRDLQAYPEIRWVQAPDVWEYRVSDWTSNGAAAGGYTMKMKRKASQ